MAIIKLPFPPSTNILYANNQTGKGKKGRHVTKRYEKWRAIAGWELVQQSIKPIKGNVKLQIVLVRPDRRRRDLSNYIKAIEDLLVEHGIIEDDEFVTDLRVHWSKAGSGARVQLLPDK